MSFIPLGPRRDPRLISLLRAASEDRTDLPLDTFNDVHIRWAIKSGLGPLLIQSTRGGPDVMALPEGSLVRGADLTARMLVGQQMEAMTEIIDACQGRVKPLTLLKGISICEQHYPEPHLRPMRDIDFLVSKEEIPVVEEILKERGYEQKSRNPPEFYKAHHHSVPLFQPQKQVWVEVHSALFPPGSVVGSDPIFSLESIRAEERPSKFWGRSVRRLSDEFQIIYLASHWAFDFRIEGSMVPMLDLIYLLKHPHKVDWTKILSWVHNSVAATYLYLLLTYLHKYGLIDIAPEILHSISRRQKSFGALNLRILHSMIDRWVVEGRDFGVPLSKRSFEILWKTFLQPNRPARNLFFVPWNLLPSRLRQRFHGSRAAMREVRANLRFVQGLLLLWILAIGYMTTMPWSYLTGHSHWQRVTWIPFSGPFKPWDILANLILYLPFGYLYTASRVNARRYVWLFAALAAAVLSAACELFQVYCHNRVASATDLVSNTLGASLGAWLASIHLGLNRKDRTG